MSNLVRGGLIAAVLALVINIIIYMIGSSQNISWAVTGGMTDTVSMTMVIIATLVTTVAAIILFWLLQRMSENPMDIFLWIALIAGLLSLIPVYLGTQSRATLIALGLMHVASAMSIVWGFLFAMRHVVEDEA